MRKPEGPARPLTVRYAYSRQAHAEANAQGSNYWCVYVEEILDRLGVCARRMDACDCADPGALGGAGVLVLGDFAAGDLPAGAAEPLRDWVVRGGVLIGLATRGLDSLFGVRGEQILEQAEGPFSIGAYLRFQPSPMTADCRAPVESDQNLIIVSPVRLVPSAEGTELARLLIPDPARPGDGRRAVDSGSPAVTHRVLGRGHAFYFCFNLAQTLWLLMQGRPVDQDYDGDGYLRTPDAAVIGENSPAVPYADALHFLLAGMIGRKPVPMIHQVPCCGGQVAPAMLFFGGDDEHEPGIQVAASDFMAARGLPYHINVMPMDGTFAVQPAEQARIEANGHELALHYNFMDGFRHPCGFTRGDVRAQARRFREAFGRDSFCSAAHWLRWTGWADPARWMSEAGGRGDNSYFNWTVQCANPVNTLGFLFGSALPRHFWDDARHGNVRLPVVELPIVAYEYGYLGEQVFPEKIGNALDLACRYRLVMNFFYHPCYIAGTAGCRGAIDELVRRVRGMPVPPVLAGPDEVCRWWQARSEAEIHGGEWRDGAVTFDAECAYPGGFVVKVPAGRSRASACEVDGTPAKLETAFEFGQYWAFVPLSAGKHTVRLSGVSP